LRTAMLRIQNPTAEAIAAIEEFGMSVAELKAEQSIIGVTNQLVEAGLTIDDIGRIFPARAVTVISSLMKMQRSGKPLEETFKRVKFAGKGLSSEMRKFQDLGSTGRQFEIIRQRIKTLFATIGAVARPAIAAFQKEIFRLLDTLRKPENVKVLAGMVTGIYRLGRVAIDMAFGIGIAVKMVARFAQKAKPLVNILVKLSGVFGALMSQDYLSEGESESMEAFTALIERYNKVRKEGIKLTPKQQAAWEKEQAAQKKAYEARVKAFEAEEKRAGRRRSGDRLSKPHVKS
jgi:hypothetical protein